MRPSREMKSDGVETTSKGGLRPGVLSLMSTVLIGILLAYSFVTHSYLTSNLTLVTPDLSAQLHIPFLHPPQSNVFALKHIYHHNTGKNHRLHRRLDITPQFIAASYNDAEYMESLQDPEVWPTDFSDSSPYSMKFTLDSHERGARRLVDRHPNTVESYLDFAFRFGAAAVKDVHLEWNDEMIQVPNITNKNTLVALATISSNAYVRIPGEGDWVDVGEPWDEGIGHGWEAEGLRGHVFTNEDETIIVIGIKGTSATALAGGDSDTVGNDKINDNLLFSCCCARISYLWSTVCDCYEKSYTCNQDCLEKEMYRKDRYYQATLDVYRNVSSMYPDATIWVTGHSLGGALASLLGRTYGLPAVTFEAPGELLATKRLHLPMAPGLPKYLENIWHFGHTADPIFMGVCNGASSSCAAAGYAMETQCRTGKQCIYDVVTDKGWHVNMLNHRIHTVIDEVIMAYNETPACVDPPPCRDCFNWRFVSHRGEKNPLPEPPVKGSTTSSIPLIATDTETSTDAESDTKTKTSTETGPVSTSSDAAPPKKCLKKTWYGWCYEYEGDGDGDGDGEDGDVSS